MIVGRQPEIALYTSASLERGSEGKKTILGKTGAIMKAPMRKSGRAGVKRVNA